MKKISTFFMMAICMVAVVSMTSCKDYDDDRYFDQNTSVPIESSLKDLLEAQKKDLQNQIDALKAQLAALDLSGTCNCKEKWDAYYVKIEQITNEIAALQDEIEKLKASIPDVSGKADKDEVDKLNKLIEELQGKIKELQAKLDNQTPGSSCECDWAGLQTQLSVINTTLESLQTQLNGKADKAALDALEKTVADMNTNLKAEILALGNRIATLEAAQVTINNAITKLEGDVTNINNTLTLLSTGVDALGNKVSELEQTLATLTTLVNTKVDAEYVQGEIAIVQNQLTSLINDLQRQIDELKNNPGSSYDDTALRNLISALDQRVTTVESTVDALKTTVATLQTTVSTLQSDMTTLQSQVNGIAATASANEAWINAMKALYGDNLEKLVNLDPTNPCTCALADSVAMLRAEADSLVHLTDSLLREYVDKAVDGLDGRIVTLETQLTTIEEAYKAADKELQDQIDALKEDVADLQKRMDAVEKEIEKIQGDIEKILNVLHSQITGVITQGVTNPLFGSVSLPVGIRTNLLVAYYGTCETGGQKPFEFPLCKNSDSWTGDVEDRFTKEELAGVATEKYGQGADMLLDGANAGKVYLTVNPSTVNFDGAQFKLVNSRNEESGITLSAVRPSDKLLTFGVSRSAENGFYEADATLAAGQGWKNSPNVSKGNLKDLASKVKTLIKERTGVKAFVSSLYTNLSDVIEMPAYALQASYTTDEGKTAYVHSNYDIAALAVKPLSYNLDLGAVASKIPHKYLRQVPYLKDKLLNIKNTVHDKMFFKFDEIEVKANIELNITDINFNGIELIATATAHYDRPTSYDKANDKLEFEDATTTVTVKVPATELDKLAKKINEAVIAQIKSQLKDQVDVLGTQIGEAVNASLANTATTINKQVDDVLNYLYGYAEKGDDYIKKLNNYIGKVNNLLEKIYDHIDNANHYLQPVLLFSSNGNFRMMSSLESQAGSVNSTTLTLIPTSYLAETINPAYKKFILVTSAKKNGVEDAAAAKAANDASENVGKVLDGNTRAVKLTGLKAGYTYEIAYSAIDYCGYQTVQRYYVTVK